MFVYDRSIVEQQLSGLSDSSYVLTLPDGGADFTQEQLALGGKVATVKELKNNLLNSNYDTGISGAVTRSATIPSWNAAYRLNANQSYTLSHLVVRAGDTQDTILDLHLVPEVIYCGKHLETVVSLEI